MAEGLILNIAPDRPDLARSELDAKLLCIDDIVTVQEDGWPWSPNESRSAWIKAGFDAVDWSWNTMLYKWPGVPVADVVAMLEPHRVPLDPSDPDYSEFADDADNVRTVYRRRWKLDLGSLAPSDRDRLHTTGELMVRNWSKARKTIKSKVDGSDFPQTI